LRHGFDEAVAEYRFALQLDPKLFFAHLNLGLVELARGSTTAALAALDEAINLNPSSVEAQTARLRALQSLGVEDTPGPGERSSRSSSAEEMAIARARTLLELDRNQEALDMVQGVESTKGLVIRSAALWNLERHEEATCAAEAATRNDPRDAEAHMEFAYLCLKAGDFVRGWDEYEHRLESPHARMRASAQKVPAWNGEKLLGKAILVLSEQGHGDTLQFVRYLRLLHERGARVSAVVQPALLTLLRSFEVPVTWYGDAKSAGQADRYVHLLSLPRLLATRLESIPQDVPYLHADAQISAAWDQLVGPKGFKVGIAWQGNPDFPRDHLRSIPLAQFATLGILPGVRLISLQSIHGLGQLGRLRWPVVVENLGEKVTDNPEGLNEIAGVMHALDLVVTSDTAVAHLAGALGRPVWVALSHDPDWRWMRGRTDSPWYPTMRLFRQKKRGDWPGVFAEIADALRPMVERGHA
jgi:tetratricopeptide (TPR) repeat protein